MEVSSTCMKVPERQRHRGHGLAAPLSAGAGAAMAAFALTGRAQATAGDAASLLRRLPLAAEPRRLVRLRAGIVRDDGRDPRIHRRIIARARLRGQRHVAHRRRHERTRGVVQIHAHRGRESDAQRMRLELLRIEQNAHRHALHDLDPVAGGVLRRQQRKGAAAAGGDADQVAVIRDAAAVQIGAHGHRLAGAHALELHFLEVGIDPHIVERHHRQQRRARRDPLADLHGALGDDAAHRRGELGAMQGERGVAHGRGRGQHLRMVRDGRAVDLRDGLTQVARAPRRRWRASWSPRRAHARAPRRKWRRPR